ncbi:MAG: NAD-dependent epimerase/dehydratase family protein, partial [Leptolyngbya sp. Prado105]|nr:NAD-dependent epimerase/dehydratase family protein [Leptolyngbya sp. Prado105]
MRILIMGGTRFIGVYLTKLLVEQGHEVTLFNRGNKPAPVAGVKQVTGDRTNADDLKQLASLDFDAVFDNNGR